MKVHNYLKHNGLEYPMNDNDRNDTYMNETLHNGDMGSGIGLLNSHNIPQYKKSSNLNLMHMSVENGDANGDYCYMNGSTISESNNHNSVEYTKKRDEIYTNIYVMENNGLTDGVGIGDMLLASALNQYINMKYNNEQHNLQINGKISTSKKLISFNIDFNFFYIKI